MTVFTRVTCIAFVLTLASGLFPGGVVGEESLDPVHASWDFPDSVQLHYFTVGRGRNVLVIHGGPGIPFPGPLPGLSSFANNYRFVYYDQRGCGGSTRPIDKFKDPASRSNFITLVNKCGLGVHIKDIERAREKLGDEKLIIVGFSYGALLASLYAKDYPDHVESMIFIAPANLLAFPPEDGGIYELIKPLLPDSMKADYDKYLGRFFNFSTLFQQTDSSLSALNCEFAPYFFAAMKAKGVSILNGVTCESIGGWAVQGIYMSMGMSYDHRPALKSIDVPVLVLHGADDIQSEEASRTYSNTFPNATFVSIPKAGHFMWLDNEAAFIEAIKEFLGNSRD